MSKDYLHLAVKKGQKRPISHGQYFSNVKIFKHACFTTGNAWCPLMFGNMVFLANTVGDVICYTMVFEKSKKNRELGKKMLNDIKGILEENEK